MDNHVSNSVGYKDNLQKFGLLFELRNQRLIFLGNAQALDHQIL